MDGFPNWGLQPGLAAKNSPSGSVTNVTSANQIKLPKRVTCWEISSNSLVGWGGNTPVHKYSELGPTYINLRGGSLAGRVTCGEGDEVFDPRGTTMRLRSYVIQPGWRRTTTVTTTYTTWTITSNRWSQYVTTATYTTTYWVYAFTTLSTQWVTPLTAYWTVTNPAGTRTTTFYTWTHPRTTLTLVGEDVLVTPITELSTTVTATYRTTITTTWQTRVFFGPTTTTVTGPVTATNTFATTVTGSYARPVNFPNLPGYIYLSYVAEVRDAQVATFPRTVVLSRDYYSCYGSSCSLTGYYVRHYFDLAYIKVVDLWNTTNVLAYVDGRNSNAVALRVDRPIGIAAVYVYSRTEARLPPPPPPPPGRENYCIDKIEVCPSFDAGKIRRVSDTWDTAPEGQCDGQVTVKFVREGGDSNCGAWVAPGPGTYNANQLQHCPENNGQITCTVPAGSTIIHGCAR
jgi:hypothetical protein